MSNKPRVFREVTLRSALKVMAAEGLKIAGAEIAPDGTVRVLTPDGSGALIAVEPNPFDRPRKNARH